MIYSYIRMLSIFVFIHICHWKDTVYQALPSLVNFFEKSIQIEEPADSTVRNSNYSYWPHNSINVCAGCLSLFCYLGQSTEWRDHSREPRGQGNPEIRGTQRSGEHRGHTEGTSFAVLWDSFNVEIFFCAQILFLVFKSVYVTIKCYKISVIKLAFLISISHDQHIFPVYF